MKVEISPKSSEKMQKQRNIGPFPYTQDPSKLAQTQYFKKSKKFEDQATTHRTKIPSWNFCQLFLDIYSIYITKKQWVLNGFIPKKVLDSSDENVEIVICKLEGGRGLAFSLS